MKKVLIMGAAGKDFHVFNTVFRNNSKYKIVCFTAAQIPGIDNRKYPAKLAGKLYPKGIQILPEKDLQEIIRKKKIDFVVFAYSDVTNHHVMEKASIANANNADFTLIGTKDTMIKSKKKIISVCAVRTGSGKSQTSRKIAELLKAMGKKVVVVRHPMPYGDLEKMIVQRFEKFEDLEKYNSTIEEREEYEQYIERGIVVFAGVDYGKILKAAEKEADVIIWDGGNNDFPFFVPDLHIVIADPLRVGHEKYYYPGQINARMADVFVINKENSAQKKDIEHLVNNLNELNPKAKIIHADSVIDIENSKVITGKRVLVIEDGPTLTHGSMSFGAGIIAAKKANAKKLINPKRYAVGSIAEVYKKYPRLKNLVPAMGYSKKQIKDLEETIRNCKPEGIIIATPIDLRKIIPMEFPSTRIRYYLQEKGKLDLKKVLKDFLKN